MKKILAILAVCLLAGCSSKETIEVDYVHSNHNEIVNQVLGSPLGKDETNEIFENSDSIDVYYDIVDDENVTLTIFNNMEYYYTGTVEFEACEFKLSVSGLAPYAYASKDVKCPGFVEEGDFTYSGELFERNEEHAYSTPLEIYYYEDDEELYDYVLELDEISADEVKALANYLYTETILSNYEGELWARVYPKAAYDVANEAMTEEAWNQLDAESLAGTIWVDAQNDIAEIYDGKTEELVERINFR